MTNLNSLSRPDRHLAEGLLCSVIATLFLFFIDEGNYDFRWMASFGNWVVFLLYVVGTLPLYWLLARILLRETDSLKKIPLISLAGAIALIAVFVLIK